MFLGVILETAVSLARELNFGEVDLEFCVFCVFRKSWKNIFLMVSYFHVFSWFFATFGRPFGSLLDSFWSLWRRFGVSLSYFWLSLACPSRPWGLSASFCGNFGSTGVFLGLGDRSGTAFCFIFGICWAHFLKIRRLILKLFWFYFGSLLLSVYALGAVLALLFLKQRRHDWAGFLLCFHSNSPEFQDRLVSA